MIPKDEYEIDLEELLFRDLCLRLPYNVKVINIYEPEKGPVILTPLMLMIGSGVIYKPFLKPISDITPEEFLELKEYVEESIDPGFASITRQPSPREYLEENLIESSAMFRWCLTNHIDIYHLVDDDMAVRITPENNPYQE